MTVRPLEELVPLEPIPDRTIDRTVDRTPDHPASRPSGPEFPVAVLAVRPWPDPVIDEVGHDPRSPYVERYWLGLLGPSATWLLRRLATGLEVQPGGFDLDLAETAVALGLGGRGGRHSPFFRAIERCCRFGAAQFASDAELRVRRKLPPLTRGQLARLPERLQASHQQWVERGPASLTAAERMRQRARHLALSLFELGEDPEAVERQLHRWRLHPAVAREAVVWAQARHRAAARAAGAARRDAAGHPPDAA